jgi:hypothetical protein
VLSVKVDEIGRQSPSTFTDVGKRLTFSCKIGVFTAVKIPVVSSQVGGYPRFGRTCCHFLRGRSKGRGTTFSRTTVILCVTWARRSQYDTVFPTCSESRTDG